MRLMLARSLSLSLPHTFLTSLCRARGRFDWYLEFEQLEPILEEYSRRIVDTYNGSAIESHGDTAERRADLARGSLQVLDIGCGNSALGEQLYKHGWTRLTHIDISHVVIERMREEYAHVPDTYGEWITMDATQMTFAANTFHLILEKGTIDALDCTPDSERVCGAILAECARVLQPGGVFLLITHGNPHRRLPLLRRAEYGWTVETRPVGYSNSALFIRTLRQKLRGAGVASATPAIMAECALEVKQAKAHMVEQLAHAQVRHIASAHTPSDA